MGKRNKLWLSIQAVTLAGVATLGACGMESEGEAAKEGEGGEGAAEQHASPSAHQSAGQSAAMPSSHDSDGEGGEGEGDEEHAGPASDDLVYLTQLGLMRGHLLVGHQLYEQGHIDAAKTHMKHPKSELYADLVDAFTARGAKGFASELETLAAKVEGNAPAAEVTEAYTAATAAISASEGFVAKHSKDGDEQLKLAVALLREAGEEYALAVEAGKLKNVHEFQDSYGFTQIAKQTLENASADDDASKQALEKAIALIAELAPLWPSIVPTDKVSGESSNIYGAAARIELLALGLE